MQQQFPPRVQIAVFLEAVPVTNLMGAHPEALGDFVERITLKDLIGDALVAQGSQQGRSNDIRIRCLRRGFAVVDD